MFLLIYLYSCGDTPIFVVIIVRKHSTVGFSQAGAPFGSCKNVSIPTRSPVTNNAGSFTGSVQFASSASTVYSPNRLVVFMFYIPLMAFWL